MFFYNIGCLLAAWSDKVAGALLDPDIGSPQRRKLTEVPVVALPAKTTLKNILIRHFL